MKRSKRMAATLAVAAVASLVVGAAAAQAAKFEGIVTAKDKGARTFSVKQDEGGGTFKFKVNDATAFERLSGFGAVKVGAKNIEVVAKRNAKGRWVATKVSRSGKNGGGGDGGGGADDGPNHT